MFKQTANVFNNEIIIAFKDPSCVGNKALFILVNAKVDNYFRNLRMLANETATHFLRRFTVGRNQAELAGNSYDDTQLVDFLLSATSNVTNQSYLTNLSVYQMKQDDDEDVAFADLEYKLQVSCKGSRQCSYYRGTAGLLQSEMLQLQ
mmetsp:Transcript_9605/g.13883  ORF Transcript_9605/g.13883 Transcript_9605/m.13883 type:complete len:148 (-) Transcript_9605:11-454(-)